MCHITEDLLFPPSQDPLEYRRKMRLLKIRMLDGAVKSVLVDDSRSVADLMELICTKIGITNHDEYSLVCDRPEDNQVRVILYKFHQTKPLIPVTFLEPGEQPPPKQVQYPRGYDDPQG